MPAVVHALLINPMGFMFKEKPGEPLVPAFTAVNGRTSPLSPCKLSGINSMAADSLQILTRSSPPEQRLQEPRASLSARDDWNPVPPANPMPPAGENKTLKLARRLPSQSISRKAYSNTISLGLLSTSTT
ncbi:hypothetical protein DM02DRAFT_664874 [Periconia macrospinosa]|uniref:Uncharacterized protein n=1 Tax=Periconia macrospinosa TaxID=97972 RepID=A0A2V1CYQ2_9PLEO|nr:hypothetical protein DM02DRAFT_664874 [Periconia macrospinosa]